jgi:hypothetical protein
VSNDRRMARRALRGAVYRERVGDTHASRILERVLDAEAAGREWPSHSQLAIDLGIEPPSIGPTLCIIRRTVTDLDNRGMLLHRKGVS